MLPLRNLSYNLYACLNTVAVGSLVVSCTLAPVRSPLEATERFHRGLASSSVCDASRIFHSASGISHLTLRLSP